MKKRDIAKAVGSAVSFAISACSGFAASKIIKVPSTGNKWADICIKVGVGGIVATIEGAVCKHYEDTVNDLVDSIAEIVDMRKIQDGTPVEDVSDIIENVSDLAEKDETIEDVYARGYSPHTSGGTVIPFKQVPQKQAIAFADLETANYAAGQLRDKLASDGYVSLWYLFNSLEEDKVQTTISDEDMKTHGWDNLDGMEVLEAEEGKWLLVLPECIEHEPVFEAIKKTSEDGTVTITTNGVEDNA